ncbi:TlpA disulfide reductase family protein [Palleronia pelagia]|uniref:Thiol-disulfide isomerase or thioredoxin n=1 Tax=Palleronia pelagia TaxID=387096 RepID=A0A1H8J5P4_9RHOB|nr:TlpA disulfide reductase family protein [Palleronia pelagia]SEN75537.1 Thiol-disulfide isomerase or thioredoxin [Palleronia pelagia]
MKFLTLALYLGLATIANAEPAAWSDLRQGDMRKLVFHDTPRAVTDATFTTPDGAERRLSDYAGKWALVNFWALWCAPCREEMPALDTLNAEMGGEDFEVVTIAVWRNALPAIEDFFAEHEIGTLPILLDPDRRVSSAMGVLAMPITVLLNPEGQEVARMTGDADWAGDDARTLLQGVMNGG